MRLQVLKNGVCVPDAHMIVNFAYVLGIAPQQTPFQAVGLK
jgi:hypothetical protein